MCYAKNAIFYLLYLNLFKILTCYSNSANSIVFSTKKIFTYVFQKEFGQNFLQYNVMILNYFFFKNIF